MPRRGVKFSAIIPVVCWTGLVCFAKITEGRTAKFLLSQCFFPSLLPAWRRCGQRDAPHAFCHRMSSWGCWPCRGTPRLVPPSWRPAAKTPLWESHRVAGTWVGSLDGGGHEADATWTGYSRHKDRKIATHNYTGEVDSGQLCSSSSLSFASHGSLYFDAFFCLFNMVGLWAECAQDGV